MKFRNIRIISLLLVLVMLCGMMPMPAFATEETEANPWSGRSAVFVGDSITSGSGTTKIYYSFLEEALGFDSVTAMGVGGSCISAYSDYGTGNQPLINRYETIPSADLIVIFMGTNDYGHETPLGTVEDTEDGTFYGALNTIIPALVAKHTSSKIVFVTPLHRYGFGTSKILGTQFTYDSIPNGVGAALGDYVDALKNVCANNGVSVIDLYTECTLDPSDVEVRAAYIPDGLHPNASGHELIAGIMETHLRPFESAEAPEPDPTEPTEPAAQTELVYGNRFASGFSQQNRASSRVNYYLKAGTVITLKDPASFQWACAKTSNESSSNNLGYFPDSQWTDKATAVVAEDGWIGFTLKYRDETQSFDLSKSLSDYISIEEPHVHSYTSTVTAPTCTEQGYTTYTCECGDSYADSYVDATGHTYENGICNSCGATASTYLQQLPENIIGCTNLYDSLVPVKGYYTATKYDTNNGAVLSVVIPVEPGDRIAASSFGSVSENKGSVNGIRVTYLLGGKIATSLSPNEVYSGYTNNGYITVPDGVDAVCIPWWIPSDSNWLTLGQISQDFVVHSPKTVSAQAPTCTESGYSAGEICEVCNASLGELEEIPPTGHSYSGDTCSVCGTVNLLAFLDGKDVSVLGDSISTFNGYSNDAAVNTTIGGNGPRYDAGTADTKPGSYCLLESVDDTWWMHFANRSGMKLLVNNSWAGSQVFGGKTSDGRVIPAAYLDRCVNLHDNTLENNHENAPINPDVILVYLGINDYNFNRSQVGTGTVDYSSLVSSDGTYVTPATFGEAYGIMLHKMRNAYPNAQIFAMTLLPENLYSVDKTAWEQHNTYIRAAAEYYDIPVVDLAENCAITWDNYSGYMIDRIHPTTAGMKLISDCIEAELVAYYEENSSHTHDYTTVVTAPTCTEQGYTTYTCECGESYVDDYVDATGEHSYENGTCTGCGEVTPTLAGKTISILGASMSTYTGVSNNPDYNSTIGNNAVYYTEGKLGVYKNDTWWMQVADDLGLELLVNNSWSGSSLLHERNGTVGAYVDRCVQLHNNDGEEPDIIGIQMGTNDFQYYKDTLGTADIDYAALITENEDGSYIYAEPTTSLEAAAIVLHKISIRYPNAEVYYLNISQRIDGTDELIRSFNAELKQVVEHFGAHIVDIYGSAITMADFDTYIGDGRVHPNCLGMDAYTEAFKRALLANTAYKVDTHTVSLNLNGVTANYGDDKIVVSGDAFSCTLTAEDGEELSVFVTMGSEDVTDTAYENGTVSIESVTDDVVITAEATVHKPQNYRWEFDGTDLTCVSGSNALTKDTGTTTDGVFSKTSYTLDNEVVLMHDLPWIVEWKCEGTFLNTNGSSGARVFTSDNVNANYNARYIFKSNTNGIIAMGEKTSSGSHNYGIALGDYGIDWTELHTYRLENRIAADGSNMIYLIVDGEEIGPMNHYYIGTKDQNTTSDWLSGKDFVFPYMGTDTHGFTNASIDYIQVIECAHTYENGICTICGEAQPGPAIIQQPTNGEAKLGERYMVEVKAEGEGLTYQWYLRNAGSSKWYKSSVKDSTYDDVMTTARAGREVYCVITDANGNSVTTDTVKLICVPSEKLEIITQPTDGEAVRGERYCVTVEAKGEGLKYQWYFRNKGATRWTKSSVTDNTYDDIMTNTRNGREVYCVITDLAGNKVTTDIVKLVRVPMKLEITSQPTDAEAAFGEMFCATVEARGEGLKYQWYYRNAGSEEWHKSSVRDNTYDDEMTKARAGREIYCVITDQWGNTITTDTVKLIAVPEVELKLLGVSYESAAMGGRFCVTVEAEGDGLTYQWYFRNAGATRWSKSSVRDNTYDDVMNRTRANREVYCVITDMWGNTVTTETVTLVCTEGPQAIAMN